MWNRVVPRSIIPEQLRFIAMEGVVSIYPSRFWEGNDGNWSTFALQVGLLSAQRTLILHANDALHRRSDPVSRVFVFCPQHQAHPFGQSISIMAAIIHPAVLVPILRAVQLYEVAFSRPRTPPAGSRFSAMEHSIAVYHTLTQKLRLAMPAMQRWDSTQSF